MCAGNPAHIYRTHISLMHFAEFSFPAHASLGMRVRGNSELGETRIATCSASPVESIMIMYTILSTSMQCAPFILSWKLHYLLYQCLTCSTWLLFVVPLYIPLSNYIYKYCWYGSHTTVVCSNVGHTNVVYAVDFYQIGIRLLVNWLIYDDGTMTWNYIIMSLDF